MVTSYICPKARKGLDSEIAGRGLFAVEPIDAGEVVAVKGGRLLDRDAVERLSPELFETEIQITDDLHLAATTEDERDAVMLFVNHSCEPNVGFAGNIVLVAMRSIHPGEELTVDYAMFDVIGDEMPCGCSRPSCRGLVTGQDWQRPDLQQRYAGYFSWYLRRRIDAET